MKKFAILGVLIALTFGSCKTTNNYNVQPTTPSNNGTSPVVTPTTTVTTPLYDTVFMNEFTIDSSQWFFDSSINGFYAGFTQPDRNMSDFVAYIIEIKQVASWFTLPQVITGITVDFNLSATGFDINWYKTSKALPRLSQYVTFDGWVVLKHQGYKSPIVKQHLAKRIAAYRYNAQ